MFYSLSIDHKTFLRKSKQLSQIEQADTGKLHSCTAFDGMLDWARNFLTRHNATA
jgi:hypothetical protein